MALRDDDWVRQIPIKTHPRGPYEDYGWGPGESILLPFRDPTVHIMPYEREEQARWERSEGARGPEGMPRRWGGRDLEERAYHYGQGYVQGPMYDIWRFPPGPSMAGRGPRGYRRSDTLIYEDVCDRLTRHPVIDASDVDVRVEDGEVTLEGTVPERGMKRLIEDIAEEVSGVMDVHNRLKVQREAPH
jgi:hypothetical protein